MDLSRSNYLFLLTIAHVSAISIDCRNLKTLATGLNMQTTNPTISTKLSVDCCTATGITCDSTPRVKEIRWANIGLDGSIDSSLLPSFTLLTFLELSGNKLTGAIPIALPPGLIFLDLNSNEFTGTVPNAWPHTLTTIQLGANGLSGTIPTSGWPPGLQRLLMYSNALTGVIPSGFPNYLTELNLGNNQLTGSIPSLPQGLKNLHIDANRLSGTLPSNFPKLLTELHIHDNAGLTGNVTSIITMSMLSLRLGYPGTTGTSFTGTIRVNKPTQLFLNGNLITDVAISDPSLLSNVTCDISNNPLLGSSSLSYLGVCVRNGLYKITMSTSKSTIVPTSTTHFKLTLSTTQLAEDTTLSTTFTKSTFLVATTDLFSQSSDSFQTRNSY